MFTNVRLREQMNNRGDDGGARPIYFDFNRDYTPNLKLKPYTHMAAEPVDQWNGRRYNKQIYENHMQRESVGG